MAKSRDHAQSSQHRADGAGVGAPLAIDIYARLSRAVDGETIKVEDQIELCTEEILARGRGGG